MVVRELASTKLNGLNVKLFEYDINDEQSLSELKDYLIGKIRKSKVHDIGNYDLNFYGSKNLNPRFIQKFNEQVAKINVPQKHKLPQFDVRRSRVTEWMAQLLLEKEYNCKFHEEADKRMNIEPIDINKHTPGIDVPGIRIVNNQITFVICEVKASEEKKIPCSSVPLLQKDIQKSIDNNEERVTREILQYMHGIRNIKMRDEELEKIVGFLAKLIVGTKTELSKSIMFFPVLIRNNIDILQNKDPRDYKNFVVKGIDNKNIENIIFAFGYSIQEFSNEIYTEAICNE